MKALKVINECLFWLGVAIAIIGMLMASVGVHPIITRLIRPDIFAAEYNLDRLKHDAFVKKGDPGFDIIVKHCICTIPQYSEIDPAQIEMVGTDYWRVVRNADPDPYERPLTIWRQGKSSTVLSFSYRTLEYQFNNYVDNWKERNSDNADVGNRTITDDNYKAYRKIDWESKYNEE